jgi:hypothetical protein
MTDFLFVILLLFTSSFYSCLLIYFGTRLRYMRRFCEHCLTPLLRRRIGLWTNACTIQKWFIWSLIELDFWNRHQYLIQRDTIALEIDEQFVWMLNIEVFDESPLSKTCTSVVLTKISFSDMPSGCEECNMLYCCSAQCQDNTMSSHAIECKVCQYSDISQLFRFMHDHILNGTCRQIFSTSCINSTKLLMKSLWLSLQALSQAHTIARAADVDVDLLRLLIRLVAKIVTHRHDHSKSSNAKAFNATTVCWT